MGYARVSQALAAVIRKSPFYDTKNVAIGHYRFMLSKPYSVSLVPGGVSREELGPQSIRVEYEIQVRLFHKATKAKLEDVYDSIIEKRDEIFNIVDIYPTLDSGSVSNPNANVVVECITRAFMTDADEPEWEQIQRTYLWTQELSCSIQEDVILNNTGEYAR